MIGKSSSYPPYFHTWQWKFKRQCLDVFPTKTTSQKGDYQRVDLNDQGSSSYWSSRVAAFSLELFSTPWHLLQMTRSTGRGSQARRADWDFRSRPQQSPGDGRTNVEIGLDRDFHINMFIYLA